MTSRIGWALRWAGRLLITPFAAVLGGIALLCWLSLLWLTRTYYPAMWREPTSVGDDEHW